MQSFVVLWHEVKVLRSEVSDGMSDDVFDDGTAVSTAANIRFVVSLVIKPLSIELCIFK